MHGSIIKNFVNNFYVFFLLTTSKLCSGKKWTMDKNGRKDKDNDSDVQIKVDSDEDGDWETEIGKNPPPKKKHSLHFVMDSQNPAHATKSGYNVKNVLCGLR